MIASLPMYDRAETAAALDRLWTGVRAAFAGDTPARLNRNGDVWNHWRSPDLFLSQTCGMPYRVKLHGQVQLVGTPVTGLDCTPGFYRSVIVARAGDPRTTFAEFAGARLAYNESLSQSGWAAPINMAASQGVEFASFLQTGAHRASADAVADGQADLAALDALTWAMIERWDDVARRLKVIGLTPETPTLPFITAKDRDPQALAGALGKAIGGLSPDDRDTLSLYGLTDIPASAYLAVPTPVPPP